MSGLLRDILVEVKCSLDRHSRQSFVKPIFDLIESIIPVDRSFVLLGFLSVAALYLSFGWASEHLCRTVVLTAGVLTTISELRSKASGGDFRHLIAYWLVYSTYDSIETLIWAMVFVVFQFCTFGKCVFLLWFLTSGAPMISRSFYKRD